VTPSDAPLRTLIAEIGQLFLARGLTLATAESITGGAIAAACTSLPGSSNWFECGLVTYRASAKSNVLRVPEVSIQRHGVVSQEVARAMAEGALALCGAHIAVSTTGYAGPGPNDSTLPLGSVWFAWAVRVGGRVEIVDTRLARFTGTRGAIRRSAVRLALEGVLEIGRGAARFETDLA
jgi:nicotinamide-nucleotide amidase